MNHDMMVFKLVICGLTLNVTSAYAPQVALDEEEKMILEGLDKVVRSHTPRSFS